MKECFLCLFVGFHAMALCAKLGIGTFCFVQHFSIFCHGAISIVFKYSVFQFDPARFTLIARGVVTKICFAIQTQHFRASNSLLGQSRLSSIKFCVFSTAPGWKPMRQTSAVNKTISLHYVAFRNLACFHFLFNHTVLFLLVLNTVNRYPFPSAHTCPCRKILYKDCNKAPVFWTQRTAG